MTGNTAALAPAKPRSTALHVSLWVAQMVLFIMFGMAGLMKATTPIAELSQTVPWAADVPAALVRFIGTAELLGAIAVLLPAIARIKPWLTPLAALGLAVTMVLAVGFHVTRGELGVLHIPGVLGALAAFVAWGRFFRAPIEGRH